MEQRPVKPVQPMHTPDATSGGTSGRDRGDNVDVMVAERAASAVEDLTKDVHSRFQRWFGEVKRLPCQ